MLEKNIQIYMIQVGEYNMSDGPNDARRAEEANRSQLEKTKYDPELLSLKIKIQDLQRQQRQLAAQESELQKEYKKIYSKKFNEWEWNVLPIDFWD